MNNYLAVEPVSEDDSSLSTITEETSEQVEVEQPVKVSLDAKPVESAQGLLSRIYSTFAGGSTAWREQKTLKSALRHINANMSDTGLVSDMTASPPPSSGPDDENALEAMSQPMIPSTGKGNLAFEDKTRATKNGKEKLVSTTENPDDYNALQQVSQSKLPREVVSRTPGSENSAFATSSHSGGGRQSELPHPLSPVHRHRPEFLIKHFDLPEEGSSEAVPSTLD